MGWNDVGFMGSKYYDTPNIDLLSKEFVELNENTDDRDFLYQRVFLKNRILLTFQKKLK